MSKSHKSRKGISLASTAADVIETVATAPVIETVEVPTIEEPTVVEEPTIETVVTVVGDEVIVDISAVEVLADAPAPVVEAPVVVKAVKREREWRNGAARPNGGKCLQAWQHFDACLALGIVDTAGIVAAGVAIGLNAGNMRTEVTWWRKFNGIARPARVAKEVAAPAAPATMTEEAIDAVQASAMAGGEAPEGDDAPEADGDNGGE